MGIINKKYIIYSIYVFLAARASILGISPFGTAAYSIALMSYDMSGGFINGLLLFVACVIGALSTGVWQQAVISAVSIILFSTAHYFINNTIRKDLPILLKCAIAMVFANVIPMVILLATLNTTIMDVINLILQAVISFIMFFVYRIGEGAAADIIDKNTTRFKSTQEELACFAIIAIIAFLGLPSLTIFGLSFRNVISLFVIMSFGLKGGMGTGAASGIMIGILTNSSSAVIICMFSFCGFLAGLLNKMGKAGVITGFIAGNILLASMIGASKEIVYGMYETGFAAIAFAVLPAKLYDFIKIPVLEQAAAVHKENIKKDNLPVRFDYAGKVRNAAVRKAKFYSETLNEMSSEFMDIAGNDIVIKESERRQEDSCLIRVCNKVCNDCNLWNSCWKKEYKIREKALRQCEKIIEKKGESIAEIMNILNEFCIRPEAVSEELKIGIEIRRIEKICNAKIAECRSMVVKQFSEMGKISSKIADEIKRATSYEIDIENNILCALEKNEIHAYDVVVTKNIHSLPEVTIYIRKSCDKNKINTIINTVSKEIGQKMMVVSVLSGNKNGIRELKLSVKPKMNVYFGAAFLPAKESSISGDSYRFINSVDGIAYVILSDGMGTGEMASIQSEAVVRILELYIKSGVEPASAVSTVNMMLTTKNSEVLTASVDICCINCHTEKVGFIKMGAVPSVIVGPDTVKAVEINRPPVGVSSELEEISSKISEYDISEEIAVVMFTDGIYDAFNKGGINKKVFLEYIATVIRKHNKDCNGAETAAKEILNKTLGFSDNSDDMSIAIIYF